ncbi:hypothetical protein BGX21_004710 [Mortierella sp. AD011]|nr:hypothetical protein BGX20_007535 [Mortierella sp. AD010]KAF9400243.1 hypothetical protein BGX21_004710 [Mortierella sp. AD011]
MAANSGFNAQEVQELKEEFTRFDTNNDGRVDASELLELTKTLGETATQEELDFVLKSFDKNADGGLDFAEFLELMNTLRSVGRN